MRAVTEQPPREFANWVRGAGEVELARAVLEEPGDYLPEALARIEHELDARGLDATEVLTARRREEGAALPAARRRALYRGLVLAGLGLVPGFVPWARDVECRVLLDNASPRRQRVGIAGRRLGVPPESCVPLDLDLRVREAPFVRLSRWLSNRGRDAGVERPFHVGPKGMRISGSLALCDGGRLLLRVDRGSRLVLEMRRYGPDGAALGPARVVADGEWPRVLDLDRVPVPGEAWCGSIVSTPRCRSAGPSLGAASRRRRPATRSVAADSPGHRLQVL